MEVQPIAGLFFILLKHLLVRNLIVNQILFEPFFVALVLLLVHHIKNGFEVRDFVPIDLFTKVSHSADAIVKLILDVNRAVQLSMPLQRTAVILGHDKVDLGLCLEAERDRPRLIFVVELYVFALCVLVETHFGHHFKALAFRHGRQIGFVVNVSRLGHCLILVASLLLDILKHTSIVDCSCLRLEVVHRLLDAPVCHLFFVFLAACVLDDYWRCKFIWDGVWGRSVSIRR